MYERWYMDGKILIGGIASLKIFKIDQVTDSMKLAPKHRFCANKDLNNNRSKKLHGIFNTQHYRVQFLETHTIDLSCR